MSSCFFLSSFMLFPANASENNAVDILQSADNPIAVIENLSNEQKAQVLEYVKTHSEAEVAKLIKRPTSTFRSASYYGYLAGAREMAACLIQVGYSGCSAAKQDAEIASERARQLYSKTSNYNGKGDAFRHAYWNARMVHSVGSENAKIIADNHEYYNPSDNPEEDKMDYYNNEVGRSIGQNNPLNETETVCKRFADNGWLKTFHE